MSDDAEAESPSDDPPDEPGLAYPEPDPESGLPDPERELPSVPSVDVPEAPTPEGDVDGELLRDFWTTVVVFNVALLALSVGAMMVGFGVERRLGVALFAVGVGSLYRGYRKYRALEEWQSSDLE